MNYLCYNGLVHFCYAVCILTVGFCFLKYLFYNFFLVYNNNLVRPIHQVSYMLHQIVYSMYKLLIILHDRM
ncbi:hypothetical protein QVD17_12776 [Tagetes erecta]|uniref:Uncharacterized protein n=1 Tax=Tagetes erecta TaxID=13708 RepID=A0AAD8KVD0_TARER|nr:hypothetical protein QVD17_12776 [Tagetes erecta]